ncbi:MAG: DNA repair protein RecO [Bacteroidetes bacterium]|nr:DNA repair protein RecO [Bacteroidota bacterium]
MSLCTTRGIVLHQTRYSETSLIVKVYTEAFGLASFIFKGVRKTKPVVSPALLQHLSLIELVTNKNVNANLQYVKEIRGFYSYTELPYDIRKSAIAIFLNEILYKSLKEEEPNPDLFDFLITSLQILDLTHQPVSNFHLWFALQLTRFLGILPVGQDQPAKPVFNLKEGIFQFSCPDHPHYVEPPYGTLFSQFSRPGFREYYSVSIKASERKQLLLKIIEFYQLHLQGFGSMKSHEVLEEVLE